MEALDRAIAAARARYAAANPLSQAADQDAEQHLPGGNTRSVLFFPPFPLTMVSGDGAEMTDLDGHRYLDFVGQYSAGLFGHTEDAVRDAVRRALNHGFAMGAPNRYERRLAALLCGRFPSIEKIRFSNTGTEANIWAITTARAVTGRKKILVFGDAYHGGVLKFFTGSSLLNLPFDWVKAEYNDVDGTAELIERHRHDLAAILVEPILGAGGNIPGSREFLEMLRRKATETGAVLIFDEIKTARLGKGGMQRLLGVTPDMTTLGKFIGGSLAIGAFGGRSDLMAYFDPKGEHRWNHAGTFNNNVCSMAAGAAAMGEIYTEERAEEFFAWSEGFRTSLNELFAAKDVPMHCNGLGSIFAIHFSRGPVQRVADITPGCRALRPLLHMELLLDGILVCPRGDLFPSLPMTDAHLDQTRAALERFIDRHQPLIEEVLAVPVGVGV